jgi:hypothetical protein
VEYEYGILVRGQHEQRGNLEIFTSHPKNQGHLGDVDAPSGTLCQAQIAFLSEARLPGTPWGTPWEWLGSLGSEVSVVLLKNRS